MTSADLCVSSGSLVTALSATSRNVCIAASVVFPLKHLEQVGIVRNQPVERGFPAAIVVATQECRVRASSHRLREFLECQPVPDPHFQLSLSGFGQVADLR